MQAHDKHRKLVDLVAEAIHDFDLKRVIVWPKSIKKIGGRYSFVITLDFGMEYPHFQVTEHRERVRVGEHEADVCVKPAMTHTDQLFHQKIPHFDLTEFDPEVRADIRIADLKQALSEITMTAEWLEDIMLTGHPTGTLAMKAAALGVSRPLPEKLPRLQIDAFSADSPPEWGEFWLLWRFGHIKRLEINGRQYPVNIDIYHEKRTDFSSRMVYISERAANASNVEPRSLTESFEQYDLDEVFESRTTLDSGPPQVAGDWYDLSVEAGVSDSMYRIGSQSEFRQPFDLLHEEFRDFDGDYDELGPFRE